LYREPEKKSFLFIILNKNESQHRFISLSHIIFILKDKK